MTSSKFFPMKKWWTLQLVTLDRRVSHGAVSLFSRLVSHHNNKTGQCNPSQETLAKALKCSTRQIRNFTKELREAGYVETRKGCGTRPGLHYTIRWFEGTKDEFLRAEKYLQNQRKQSSGKQKKEHKKKGLGHKTEQSQKKKSANTSALKRKEEIRRLLEQKIVTHFGGGDKAWVMAMQISAADYSLEAERVVAGEISVAKVAKSLIARL